MPPSVNFDGHSYRYLMNNASRVPVGQADATVAGRSTDGIRAVGPMNTDAFFVYSNPDDPDGIAWTGRIVEKLALRRPCFNIASSQRKTGRIVTFTTFQVPMGAGRLFDPGVIGKEAMTRFASTRSSMWPFVSTRMIR